MDSLAQRDFDHVSAKEAYASVARPVPSSKTRSALYAPSEQARLALGAKVREIFKDSPGVVDVDWYVEADQPKTIFVVDKEKAALHGISAETISQAFRIAVDVLARNELVASPSVVESRSGAVTVRPFQFQIPLINRTR